MLNWTTKKNLAAALVLGATLGSALAEGLYAGGGVSYTKVNVDCRGLSTCHKFSAGGNAMLGYALSDRFAVEAGYFDLGHPTSVVSGTEVGVRSRGAGMRGLAFMPLDRDARGYLGAGVNWAQSTITSVLGDQRRNAAAPSLVAGIDYSLLRNLELRSEIMAMRLKSPGDNGYTATGFSFGLKYRF